MNITLKKIILSVMLAFVPAFTPVFFKSNYVLATPPKPVPSSRKTFSVPLEFMGDFCIPEPLIAKYNEAVKIPASNTQALIEWKKDLFNSIDKSYDDVNSKVKATILFYISEKPKFLNFNKDIKSINDLKAKDNLQNFPAFQYLPPNDFEMRPTGTIRAVSCLSNAGNVFIPVCF